MTLHINTENLNIGGTSHCSPISNRLAPQKNIKNKNNMYKYCNFNPSGPEDEVRCALIHRNIHVALYLGLQLKY